MPVGLTGICFCPLPCVYPEINCFLHFLYLTHNVLRIKISKSILFSFNQNYSENFIFFISFTFDIFFFLC